MKQDDLMMRAGAVWCDDHNRWECSKKSKRRPGDRCHATPPRGTNACRIHGGQKIDVLRAKGEALSAWTAEIGQTAVTPAEAVMAMLQMSWARVHVYARFLRDQVEADEAGGLVGRTSAAAAGVGVYESGDSIRALAKLEADERDRCVRFAKAAHDMGIADREIRLAEQQGALLAGAISQILDRLELTATQRALVPSVVPTVLRGIAVEAS